MLLISRVTDVLSNGCHGCLYPIFSRHDKPCTGFNYPSITVQCSANKKVGYYDVTADCTYVYAFFGSSGQEREIWMEEGWRYKYDYSMLSKRLQLFHWPVTGDITGLRQVYDHDSWPHRFSNSNAAPTVCCVSTRGTRPFVFINSNIMIFSIVRVFDSFQ